MEYAVFVDWDGDGGIAEAIDDITAYINPDGFQCRRGRDRASQLTGRSAAGELTVNLDNSTGRFSSFEASSPLAGKLLGRHRVFVKAGLVTANTPIWTGYLASILPMADRGGVHTATLKAEGILSILERKKVTVAPQASIGTGDAIGLILDAAGIAAGLRSIDTGQTTMANWSVGDEDGEQVSALQALRDVEESEPGFIYENASGQIVFEDSEARLRGAKLASQATYSDSAGAALPFRIVDQEDPLNEIYNVIKVQVQQTSAGASGVRWTLGEVPFVEPGDSMIFEAVYPTPGESTGAFGVDAWVDPASSTDYTANSESGGGGTNLTANITRTVLSKGRNKMVFELANGATVRAYLTLVQARGAAITRGDPTTIVERDEASILEFEEQEYPVPGKYIADANKAQDYARWVKSIYAQPIPVIELETMATVTSEMESEVLAREISDRVTVDAETNTGLGINRPFFVEAIVHAVQESGALHYYGLELSPTEGFAGFWVTGTSRVGADNAFARAN